MIFLPGYGGGAVGAIGGIGGGAGGWWWVGNPGVTGYGRPWTGGTQCPGLPEPSVMMWVIEQVPLIDTYCTRLRGSRCAKVQKWIPFIEILYCECSATIETSKDWWGWTGLPPWRSSAPQTWFLKWFRTIAFSWGRMLRWSITSSLGWRAAPLCKLIWQLKKNSLLSVTAQHFTVLSWKSWVTWDKIKWKSFKWSSWDGAVRHESLIC